MKYRELSGNPCDSVFGSTGPGTVRQKWYKNKGLDYEPQGLWRSPVDGNWSQTGRSGVSYITWVLYRVEGDYLVPDWPGDRAIP